MKYIIWTLQHLSVPFMVLLTFLGLLLLADSARADVVSEIGIGYKLPQSTSIVLKPECHVVHLHSDQSPDLRLDEPGSPHWGRGSASCGGDNPAFIGWPIAWESEWIGKRKAIRVRAGWFHYSNWFDGGKKRETHMDLAAVTTTINWTHRRRNRR